MHSSTLSHNGIDFPLNSSHLETAFPHYLGRPLGGKDCLPHLGTQSMDLMLGPLGPLRKVCLLLIAPRLQCCLLLLQIFHPKHVNCLQLRLCLGRIKLQAGEPLPQVAQHSLQLPTGQKKAF